MTDTRKGLSMLPLELKRKITAQYGSLDKFYATVYLIARNAHQTEISNVPGAEQRLKTIRAYQGMIQFMLDEAEVDGKLLMDNISTDYLEDFIRYKEQDFGMTNEEFIEIIKRI